MHKIRKLMSEQWEVNIKHVYREANCCAYALARMGCASGVDLIVLEHPSDQLRQLLLADQSEVA